MNTASMDDQPDDLHQHSLLADEAIYSVSGSSSEEDDSISFDFDSGDTFQLVTATNTPKHPWSFDMARKDLDISAVSRGSVDDIIKRRVERGETQIMNFHSDSGSDTDDKMSNEDSPSNDQPIGSVEKGLNEEIGDSDYTNYIASSDLSSDEGDMSDHGSHGEDDDQQDDHPNHINPFNIVMEKSHSVTANSDSANAIDLFVNVDKTSELDSLKELKKITSKRLTKLDENNPVLEVGGFESLLLSRPILRAISSLNYSKPTPIQLACIPKVLRGRDISASATTGSGKTAAFIIPILERLLYRQNEIAVTRVLILTPTRELAVQCHSVTTNLAKYSNNITCALITGGMLSKKQQMDLRARPDIIVATPGRVIDHLLNTQAFGFEEIEILVLDEADRLLELGFSKQIEEIVTACPKTRQTMLFSATMTHDVESLALLSLKNPVHITVDPIYQVAHKLRQEFIRVRKNTIQEKCAVLLALCTRTFKKRALIFCSHKITVHRLKIVFALVGLNAVELHGDLSQAQRFDSLEKFRDEEANFMVASDVASRGLDVLGIDTVINFDMPLNLTNYVHRVGRTARAGRSGCAVSLIGESERKLFKIIIKNSNQSAKQRIISHKSLMEWKEKVDQMEDEIRSILKEEKVERHIRIAEIEATRTVNIIEHQDEIKSRPPREWIMSDNEKKQLSIQCRKEAKDEKSKYKSKTSLNHDDESEDEMLDDHSSNKKRKFKDIASGRNSKSAGDKSTSNSKSKFKPKRTKQDLQDLKQQRILVREKRKKKNMDAKGRHHKQPAGKTSAQTSKRRNKSASGKKAGDSAPQSSSMSKTHEVTIRELRTTKSVFNINKTNVKGLGRSRSTQRHKHRR